MPRRFSSLHAIIATTLLLQAAAMAGPPYVTDDPEPLEQGHWEIFVAATPGRLDGDWSGLGPFVDANYGFLPDVQLNLVVPFAFQRPHEGPGAFGFGDIGLATKIRFFHETDELPMLSIYPQVVLPTGDRNEGLGNGRSQAYLPLWIQKSYGPWTTYGGVGRWFNPGIGNRDWWYTGWVVQRQITKTFNLGAEIFHTTAATLDSRAQTSFTLGGIYDFSETYHLLLSVGHSFQGPGQLEAYFGIQITFGPEEPDKAKGGK